MNSRHPALRAGKPRDRAGALCIEKPVREMLRRSPRDAASCAPSTCYPHSRAARGVARGGAFNPRGLGEGIDRRDSGTEVWRARIDHRTAPSVAASRGTTIRRSSRARSRDGEERDGCLSVDPVVTDSFRIEPALRDDTLSVSVTGTGDMAASPPLSRYVRGAGGRGDAPLGEHRRVRRARPALHELELPQRRSSASSAP